MISAQPTTGQLSIDDYMGQVESNANEAWKRAAMNAIRQLCSTKREWTADDLWDILAGEEVGTHEPRALGAMVIKAAKLGLCRATDRMVKSRLPIRHKRKVQVWESCELRESIPR